MRFGRAAALVVTAGFVSAGCRAYQAIDPMPEATGTVRVSWDAPRTIAVQPASGPTSTIDEVTRLVGRIDRVSADTAFLRLDDVRGPSGIIGGVPRGAVVAVVRERGMRMERSSFSTDRTLGLLLGGGALVTAIALFFARQNEDIVY